MVEHPHYGYNLGLNLFVLPTETSNSHCTMVVQLSNFDLLFSALTFHGSSVKCGRVMRQKYTFSDLFLVDCVH